jgi:hypothetical protein
MLRHFPLIGKLTKSAARRQRPRWRDGGRKKPRRPGAGQVRDMECPRVRTFPAVSESFASDCRAANLRPVSSTGSVKGAAPAVADGC